MSIHTVFGLKILVQQLSGEPVHCREEETNCQMPSTRAGHGESSSIGIYCTLFIIIHLIIRVGLLINSSFFVLNFMLPVSRSNYPKFPVPHKKKTVACDRGWVLSRERRIQTKRSTTANRTNRYEPFCSSCSHPDDKLADLFASSLRSLYSSSQNRPRTGRDLLQPRLSIAELIGRKSG